MQAWEVLDATEAELCATKARLASANEALDAAKQREEQLLRILEKKQTRVAQIALVVTLAVLVTIIVIVLLAPFVVELQAG